MDKFAKETVKVQLKGLKAEIASKTDLLHRVNNVVSEMQAAHRLAPSEWVSDNIDEWLAVAVEHQADLERLQATYKSLAKSLL